MTAEIHFIDVARKSGPAASSLSRLTTDSVGETGVERDGEGRIVIREILQSVSDGDIPMSA